MPPLPDEAFLSNRTMMVQYAVLSPRKCGFCDTVKERAPSKIQRRKHKDTYLATSIRRTGLVSFRERGISRNDAGDDGGQDEDATQYLEETDGLSQDENGQCDAHDRLEGGERRGSGWSDLLQANEE
jgi:hypothetical protein